MASTRPENIQARPSSRSDSARPSSGTQGRALRTTSPAITFGVSMTQRVRPNSGASPASQAERRRARSGISSRSRASTKGAARMASSIAFLAGARRGSGVAGDVDGGAPLHAGRSESTAGHACRRSTAGYADGMESIPPGPRSPWLVFGLSGQIGDALREAHGSGDPPLLALSRSAHPDAPGLRWLQGELPDAVPALAETPAAVLSLGPLDLFARWFEASPLRPARVVALGSTSVHGKQGSPDPAEQALVARLREAEERLARAADQRGSALTLLRPTLV